MPADANPYGAMFVGWIFGHMAHAAGSLVSRRSGKRAPVVAADSLQFVAPVMPGDELSIWADVVATGRTSYTMATDAWRRDRHGEDMVRVAQGRFTLVAVGGDS